MADEKKKEATEIVKEQKEEVLAGFQTTGGFDLIQRAGMLLSESSLIPKEFQKNVANCVIAINMAARIGCDPLMVCQNLYIVHGKPGWSSQFIIAAINSTKKYSPLRFEVTGEGMAKQCIAWAVEHDTEERLESPPVSLQMAKDEGWSTKNGSKWKTLPELMLRYRSATFFGRLYAPEVLMGMQTYEEVQDVSANKQASAKELNNRFSEPTNPVADALEERMVGDTGEVTEAEVGEPDNIMEDTFNQTKEKNEEDNNGV